MRKIAAVLMFVLVLICANTSFGAEKYTLENYLGVNYSMATYSGNGVADASLGVMNFVGGAILGDNFAGEIRFGFGVQDDSVREMGDNINVEADSFFGIYAKPMLRVENFMPYLLLGIAQAKMTVSGYSESDSGISYGMGADIKFSEKIGFTMEYIMVLNEEYYEVDALSFGVKGYF